MDRILFSHSYFLRFDPKQWAGGQPYPPLATLYAASLMRENGFDVALFDTMFAYNDKEVIGHLEKHIPNYFVLYDDGFNYLTKMCLTNMRQAAFNMIKLAKEHGCTVVVSSSDSTDHYQQYLSEGADFIIIGEGEVTLLELITLIKNGDTDYQIIKGLAFIKNETITKTAARPVLKDIDSLPMPAWDLINMDLYKSTWLKHKGYFSLNMSTTRGCPFKCNWCAKPIYGNRYNARSPKLVVKELKWLKLNYGFNHIWFCDDIFGLKPDWVNEFADLIKHEALEFKFKIQSRADLLIDEINVEALARAGCSDVWIGAESGSQKILDAMDKGTTIHQIEQATTLLKRHGINPCFFIQFGYLGETFEDINLTIGMVKKLMPQEIGISVSYPLPGTLFYEKVKADLKGKTNWTDSNEMALMFNNTYRPAFYKYLHQFVHKNYRKQLALQNLDYLIAHPNKSNLRHVKKALSYFYYLPAVFIGTQKLKRLQKLP